MIQASKVWHIILCVGLVGCFGQAGGEAAALVRSTEYCGMNSWSKTCSVAVLVKIRCDTSPMA